MNVKKDVLKFVCVIFLRGIRVCDEVDVALAGRMLGDELEPVG
jgi:hypothetical protein